eukprot:5084762-Prymnesium_polylepis.1
MLRGAGWAGAAAAAAGCGLAGAAGLLASTQRALATLLSVLDLFLFKKILLLLLLDAGKTRGHFLGCPGGGGWAARATGRRCGRAHAVWRARASGRCACGSSSCACAEHGSV